MTSISNATFHNCSSLTSITIPNSVTSIGSGAFDGCSGLTSVEIPNSVTSIGENAFSGCFDLKKVIVSDIAAWCGIKFGKNYANPLYYAHHLYSDENTEITNLVIPNSVTIIGECVFYGCSNLTSITLPKNLSIIKKLAFSGCSNLESISIPASVEFIYQEAFAGCSNLKEVKALPEEPPFLYANSFSNYNITLKVPESAATKYKSTEPWSNFAQIQTLDGSEIEKEQCATPTIVYKDGKLSFSCGTEGVTFCYSVTPPSSFQGEGNEVSLSNKYTISVYAKKDGYENSETVTKEIEIQGQNGSQDVNGDGIVDTQDVLEIYKYIQEH